jgi:hypothetical protein
MHVFRISGAGPWYVTARVFFSVVQRKLYRSTYAAINSRFCTIVDRTIYVKIIIVTYNPRKLSW